MSKSITFNRGRRNSCPAESIAPFRPPLYTVNEDVVLHESPLEYNRGKRSSFSGDPFNNNNDFDGGLPGLEEEEADGKDFRKRSGSAGLKALLQFRSRHKSGGSSENVSTRNSPRDSPTADSAKSKGLKARFLESLRPRSKSDASSAKDIMSKHRNKSGHQHTPEVIAVPNGHGDQEQDAMRSRSTSWGARDRLMMQKHGIVTPTPMSQLIGSNGIRKAPQTASAGPTNSGEHKFTGKALMWRSNSIDDPSNAWATEADDLEKMNIADLELNDPLVFNKFMRAHKCYDLIPTSAKLIVFDTTLSVKKAFFALVYNCVRAAPLWDSLKQQFVGMLTISDFILVLHKYYRSPAEKMNELEEHKICTWREELSSHYKPFASISPDASVYDAVKILVREKVHRLPIVDPISGNALYILTHKRILKFLHLFMKQLPKPNYWSKSIGDLHIGTFENIATVTPNTKLIEALHLFVSRRVSALPVIDKDGTVGNVYAKFDVINLAADKSYNNLEVSVGQAVESRRTGQEAVFSCHRSDSLGDVLEKVVKAEVHRLIITTEANRLDGIISLSDILTFLMQEDLCLLASTSAISCAASAAVEKMELALAEQLEAI